MLKYKSNVSAHPVNKTLITTKIMRPKLFAYVNNLNFIYEFVNKNISKFI